MPRMRDVSKDSCDPRGCHGSEDYNVHEQGYEGRPINATRGSLDAVEPSSSPTQGKST